MVLNVNIMRTVGMMKLVMMPNALKFATLLLVVVLVPKVSFANPEIMWPFVERSKSVLHHRGEYFGKIWR